MSPTHDMIIDNSTGANVRADINNALAALVSNSSSSSEPATKYAYMWWADTTTGILKIRNSANNAWVELLQLDGTLTLEDGSNSSPALAFRDDLNTGIFSSASDTFNIATGGVERVEFGAATIFNDTGADVDLRIEGDTDQNLLFCNAGGNAVGIGTSTPGSKLHIFQSSASAATGNSGAGLSLESNSHQYIQYLGANNKEQGILFGDDADNDVGSIVYNHSDNKLTFATAANMRLMIDSSGRLLIGTSTSKSTSAGQYGLLNIQGGAGTTENFVAFSRNEAASAMSADDEVSNLTFTDSVGYEFARIKVLADAATGTADTPGRLVFLTTPDGASAAQERLRIDKDGNVSIGIAGTTNKFHVEGTTTGSRFGVDLSSSGITALAVTNESNADIEFVIYDGRSSIGSSVNIPIAFHTNGKTNEVMRMDTSGRLLVNQTSTSIATKIVTTVTAGTSTTWAQCGLAITHASAINRKSLIGFGFSGNGGTNPPAAIGSTTTNTASFEHDALVFYTRNVTTDTEPSERVRIDENGNFFVGCTDTPSSSVTGFSVQENDGKCLTRHATSITGANNMVVFINPNGNVGFIQTNGSGTSFLTSSDYRLKENETAISDGITRLKTLKPYRFNFKADPTKTVDGFFAHEVTAVPEAITGIKDEIATQAHVDKGLAENVGEPVYQGIDQAKLVPLLTAALQEAVAKLEVLETKVAALEAA